MGQSKIALFRGGRSLGQGPGVEVLSDVELLLRAICQLLAAVKAGDPRQFPPLEHILQDLPLGPAVRIPTAGNILAGAQLITTWPAVPQGWAGIVRQIGTYSDAPTVIRIQARVNGIPRAQYDGVFGAIGSLETPFDTVIDLDSGDVFD
ncbi:MAG: hypothetical protein HY713_00735, partial [candidate division NC10 bacterium]|nr:hypothetical protein [candidate division NC10 bacterium]